LRRLHRDGTTILLSSHLLAEVDQLCTKVGVLDRGHLVLQEELAGLRAPTGRTVVETSDVDRALAVLDGRVERREGDRLLVRAADAAELNERLVRAGVRVRTLGAERRTLEEVITERTSARGPGEVAR
jgi:ABC-2 type transport system ATP-binding protein